MQITGQNQQPINPQYNCVYNCASAPVAPVNTSAVQQYPQQQYNPPYYPPQITTSPGATGVNIQIFNPSVTPPGAQAPTYNVNAPNYYPTGAYPSNYYTTQMGQCPCCHCNNCNNGINQANNPYKQGGLLDPNDKNNPYGADPQNPNNPYRPGGAFDSTNPNNPYRTDSGYNPKDPNSPNNPYRAGGPLDPNNPNNPYGANPNDPNNPYRPNGPLDPNNKENKYGAGGLLDPNNPISPYYNANTNTTNISSTGDKTEKKRVVLLNDNYIMNLENMLNSQDKSQRITAAKEVFERLDEDPSRKDDKALTALINKMLQDPVQEIRLIALSALEGRICNGDDFTVAVLQQMQTNPQGQGYDAADASRILLDMSAQRVDKDVPVDPDKRTKIKTEEKKEDKKSQIKSHNK